MTERTENYTVEYLAMKGVTAKKSASEKYKHENDKKLNQYFLSSTYLI